MHRHEGEGLAEYLVEAGLEEDAVADVVDGGHDGALAAPAPPGRKRLDILQAAAGKHVSCVHKYGTCRYDRYALSLSSKVSRMRVLLLLKFMSLMSGISQ